ncbi:quercetin dioxygenase-like cupin family protein [Sphingopyxis panaciterrae]|uniref:hypothetical protein n=1 Tax=Sphingopyxis panaciterrae TaxID=363841 RepID=UPI00141DE921|nr:hypothetical protein [Sphingopyxis panaciterrae]NIJ37550.1 quercetin dioxygenase-like cupin family protein [Sphingopyxis panaciterrae]
MYLRIAFIPLALLSANIATEVSASPAGSPGDRAVRVIRPAEVEPTVRAGDADQASGRAVHRRVVSSVRDGSTGLDIGYNVYATGVGTDKPYAYNKDELCYFPSGEIDMESSGIRVIARQGYLMWRPASAATENIHATKDSVTVCAFAPARADQWSHRLPPEQVGQWKGSEGSRPHVRFFNLNNVPGRPCDDCSGGVTRRELLSAEKDGSQHASVTNFVFEKGSRRTARAAPGDEICWVESGTYLVETGSGRAAAASPDFIYRPKGAAPLLIEATSPGSLICFEAGRA